MNRHWQARTPRERRVLLAGAVVLALVTLWVGAWEPLQQSRTALRQEVADNAATLPWLRAAAEDPSGLAAPVADDATLLARVDAAARAHGLQAQLANIEPEGDRRIRLQFADVPFDALARCLAALAGQGVSVEEISLQRGPGAGRVQARLGLADTRT